MLKSSAVGSAILVALAASPSHATVNVTIDLSRQRMHVQGSGGSYDWPVSTARSGYVTPGGVYRVQRLMKVYYSKKYDNAPMPNAIFYSGGYAIHGTSAVAHLGHPASHGCVRLAPGNAARLFEMVRAEGALISIGGSPPASQRFYARAVERYVAPRVQRAGFGDQNGQTPRYYTVPSGYGGGYGYASYTYGIGADPF